jgi:propionyl-CoA synthetase
MVKYLQDAPGYYQSGDCGYYDSDGYLNVMTRLDDIINTAGHRLSTASM